MSRITIEPSLPGLTRPKTWGRKDQEYIADFEMVARRTLDEDEHRLFRYHFYLGADWRLCCRKLNVDRGAFFHAVYKIEEKLGKVFRELRPYALYPVEDYFNGGSCWPESASEQWRADQAATRVTSIRSRIQPKALRFPAPERRAA